MKKANHYLWGKVISFSNLLLAYHKAAKGKRSHPSVAGFEYNLESNLLDLQAELKGGVYRPGAYVSFYVHDPKVRLISAAPFRDRVVHHALCNWIEPLFEPKFIYDTYANRIGKGTHRALNRCTKYLRQYRYVLPADVRQFFPSIDHGILLQLLAQTVQDERFMQLCQRILESGRGILNAEYDMVYYPGDDLLAALRPRGLPIGNLTSQFWANVYLNGFDHFVKRQLGCRGYIRYVDDFLLFGDDPRLLHEWRQRCIEYLYSLRLTLHENRCYPRPSDTGVPFLGFQVFPDHRRMKRRKVIHARRRLNGLLMKYQTGEIPQVRLKSAIQGWINHARYGDTWGLRKAILKNIAI